MGPTLLPLIFLPNERDDTLMAFLLDGIVYVKTTKGVNNYVYV